MKAESIHSKLTRILAFLLVMVFVFGMSTTALAEAEIADEEHENNFETTLATTNITEDFTDPNFLAAVRQLIGKPTGDILAGDVAEITRINVSYENIQNIDGIQHFIVLESLNVSGNELTSLDTSSNTELMHLYADDNQLLEINVKGNPELKHLHIDTNQLLDIDVSKNPVLEQLIASFNNLTALDVRSNPALELLEVYENELTSIDLSCNPILKQLRIMSNHITELDISNNPELRVLNVSGNQLTDINVSSNFLLKELYIGVNNITEVDVGNNLLLEWLFVDVNQLTDINVSTNLALKKLDASNNELTSLDISRNLALEGLNVRNNMLSALDITSNKELYHLDIRYNNIRSVDMIIGVLGTNLPPVDTGDAEGDFEELAFWFTPQNDSTTDPLPTITAPATITNLRATAGTGRVTLNWTAPDDGGSPIIRYEFRQQTGNNWSAWIDIGLVTSRVVTGLKNGTSYRFEIKAVNAVGEGEASGTIALASGAPATITNLKATAGNGRVTLKWKAPNNNGSSITRYQYRQRTVGGSWGSWKVLSGSGVSRTVSKLSNGRNYEFQVRAANKNGNAFESNTVTVTPRKAPAAVKGLKATRGDKQVTLTWKAPNNGGAPITRYQYRQRTGNGSWGKWKNLKGLETTQVITGLKNGAIYRFQVRAVNTAGSAAASNTASATPRK